MNKMVGHENEMSPLYLLASVLARNLTLGRPGEGVVATVFDGIDGVPSSFSTFYFNYLRASNELLKPN